MKKILGKTLLICILIISAVCFIKTPGNKVQAEGTTEYGTFDKTYSDSYAVADYTGIIVKNYIEQSAPTVEGYLFAGWFTNKDCSLGQSVRKKDAINESNTYYAKFVPEKVLSVKMQVSTSDVNPDENIEARNMRFVSSVDTLNYSKIGFTLTYEENGVLVPKTNRTNTVYQRITSATAEDAYDFSPKVVDTKSEYFITATWKGTENTGIENFDEGLYVRAYWETLDGVRVYGESRYVTVNDGLNMNAINIPVKDESLKETDTVTAVYKDGDEELSVTYSGTVIYGDLDDADPYVHIRINLGETDRETMESATTLAIKNANGDTITPYVYRNYYGEFTGSADKTWKSEYSGDEFVIATAADLYGLAEIVNTDKHNFYDEHIYVVRDIKVNSGKIIQMDDTAKAELTPWTPIGCSSCKFNGTFDGQMHTISGIYVDGNVEAGLFGITITHANISKIVLSNSYFTSTTYLGSVVGLAEGGSYDTLHCTDDVLVESESKQLGGIIGRLSKSGATYTVSNSWFDGQVKATAATATSTYCGGIVGSLIQGTLNISNCLNTGSVSYTYTTASEAYLMVGGICGGTMNNTAFLDMSNCFNAGPVVACTTDNVSSIIGVNGLLGYGNKCNTEDEKSQWVLNNCYTEKDFGSSGAYSFCDDSERKLSKVSTVSKNNDSITGYQSYNSKLKNLGIYANCKDYASGVTDYWVINEDDMPTLKSFTDNWIDVGWYYTDNYVLETKEELYGFSAISQVDNFSGDIVTLGADIKANPGNAEYWKAGTSDAKRQWTPIGKETTFVGTFDGDNHTIEGIYVNETSNEAGFIAYTTGTVQNLVLANSYITNTKQQTAAVIGNFEGTSVQGVYCKDDVYVSGTGNGTGGIIGRYYTTATVSNCWFDGQVENSAQYTGGIVGRISSGSGDLTIENCLNTGDVKSTNSANAYVGGILGGAALTTPKVTIAHCLNTGSVVAENATGATGAVIGFYCSLDIDNVYVTESSVNSKEGAVAGCGSVSTSATATGEGITVTDIESEKAYKYMELDFYSNDNQDGLWIAIQGGTPELAVFSEKTAIKSFDGVQKEDVSWYHNAKSFSGKGFATQSTTQFDIVDSADLFGLAVLVNNDIEDFTKKTVRMTADIEINDADTWRASTKSAADINFTPIGTNENPFNGTFDGSSEDGLYSISGLYIKPIDNYVGLFGYAGADSLIQNLKLINSYIDTKYTYTGSVVGWLEGNLQGVYSDAILNSTMQSCGGLVGQFAGVDTISSISNSWFAGEVTSSNTYSGGIVGRVRHGQKTIANCMNNGDIINTYSSGAAFSGGLIGAADKVDVTSLNVKHCVNNGKIYAANKNAVGSIIGRAVNALNVVFQDVYTTDQLLDGSVTPTSMSGYYGVGSYSNSSMVGFPYLRTTAELTGADAYNNTSLDFYFSEEDDGYWVATDTTPVLKHFVEESTWNQISSGYDECRVNTDWYNDSPSTTTYTLFSAADLYGLAQLVNGGNSFAEAEGETDIVVQLANDIVVNEGKATDWANGKNLEGVDTWTPIGKHTESCRFDGTFLGNDKTISGIYIDTNKSYAGLFGCTATNSNLQNFKLMNSYYNSTEANAYLGSIVGQGAGTMDSIYSNAIVVSSGKQVGGLVGRINDETLSTNVTFDSANARIRNCWFDGSVKMNEAIYAGGFVGVLTRGRLEINNCLNTGEMSSNFNSNGHPFVAGYCSYMQNGAQLDIKNSLSAGHITVAKVGSVASVVGRVTGTSKMGSTLTLDNVFATKECYGYTVGGVQSEAVNEETGEVTTHAGIQNGVVVQTTEHDRLVGYCTEESGDALDYTNTWAMTSKGTPVLKIFADMVEEGITVLDADDMNALDDELYLSYWDSYDTDDDDVSLKQAVNKGVGNYVLTFKTDDSGAETKVYKQYVDALVEKGFRLYEGNDLDGVYNAMYIKDEWIVNVIYAGNSLGETTLIISTGGEDSLSENLKYDANNESTDYLETGTMTLAMLDAKSGSEDTYFYGNSFVFKLPNNHFVINDGGNEVDLDDLLSYLKEIAGTTEGEQNPVYIDAWTISHQHSDHSGLLKEVADNPATVDGIYVKAFYLSEPNTDILNRFGLLNEVQKQYVGMKMFKQSAEGECADVHYITTGQRYYFNGLSMDVIQGQEIIPYSEYGQNSAMSGSPDYNTASEILLFTTATGHTTLIGGDANYVNMQYIMDAYGVDSDGYTSSSTLQNINIFVAFHHGKNMSMEIGSAASLEVSDEDCTFIDYLTKKHTFDHVLYPCSVVYGDTYDGAFAFPNAGEANAYLNKKTEDYKTYGDGNVSITIQQTNN